MVPLGIFVLLGVVRLVATDLDTLLPESEELCEFETLADVGCSLQPPGSCEVYSLPEYDCYSYRPDCRGDKEFIEGKDFVSFFDPVKNTTTLKIWNIKVKRLLLTTIYDRETWWQVELPEGVHNISITDLEGRLVEARPIQQTKVCNGCPPPRVRFVSYRKLHIFQIIVLSVDGTPENEDLQREVKIEMHTSNDTIENCISPKLDFSEVSNGKINEVMTVEEVYGVDFCFVISLNISTSPVERKYICRMQEDMTEPLYRLPETRIDIPKWWIIGLVFVIFCLILATLFPLAIRKGLLRVECRRDKSPHSCKGYENIHLDGEVSFRNQNKLAATADSNESSDGRAAVIELDRLPS